MEFFPNIAGSVACPTDADLAAHRAAGRSDAELVAQGYVPLVVCGERRGWTLPR